VRSLRGLGRDAEWRDAGDGTIELELRRDDDVVITSRGARPDLSVGPVTYDASGPSWSLT
jgi:alpha-L-fucosidase 2